MPECDAIARARARASVASDRVSSSAVAEALPLPAAPHGASSTRSSGRPRPKRARTGLLAAAAAGSQASATSSSRDAGSDVQTAEVGKQCMACYRTAGYDGSALGGNQPLTWLYADSRGLMCRDCGDIFRIAFKISMPPGVFDMWILEADNRLEWQRLLISYLSLKREGISHVNLTMLRSRQSLLTWLFDVLQLPFPSMQVVAADTEFLLDMAKDKNPGKYLLNTPSGIVGVVPWVPMSPAPTPARFVTRAQAARSWPVSPLWDLPRDFLEMWRSSVGDLAASASASVDAMLDDAPAGAEAAETSDAAAAAVTQQELACMHKVNAIETTCKILVSSVLGNGFMNCREQDFTPVATKVLTLKESMCQTGLGQFVTRLSDLHAALSAAKRLVRPLQAFVTSGKRSVGDKLHNDFVITMAFG